MQHRIDRQQGSSVLAVLLALGMLQMLLVTFFSLQIHLLNTQQVAAHSRQLLLQADNFLQLVEFCQHCQCVQPYWQEWQQGGRLQFQHYQAELTARGQECLLQQSLGSHANKVHLQTRLPLQ